MAAVVQLAQANIFPVLSGTTSIVGSLLGVLLAAKARSRCGRTRVRLLCYAALACGGAAVGQAGVISLLDYDPGVPVRFDALTLGIGLVAGVAGAGTGLGLIGQRDNELR